MKSQCSLRLDFLPGESSSGWQIFDRLSGANHGIAGAIPLQHSIDPDTILKSFDMLNRPISVATLIAWGNDACHKVFPDELVRRLAIYESGDLLFMVPPRWADIPFELLHLPNGFLGERFLVGTIINTWGPQSPEKQQHHGNNLLIVADPSSRFQFARREGEELKTFAIRRNRQVRLMVKADREKLVSEIREASILHFAGHCGPNKNDDAPGWELSNGGCFDARAIRETGTGSAMPWLVVSNSCDVGCCKVNTGLSGIAGAFLAVGVRQVIGPFCKVYDEESAQCSLIFYKHLFNGKSAAQALCSMRNDKPNGAGITPLLYRLFGDPRFNPATAGNWRWWRIPTVLISFLLLISLSVMAIRYHESISIPPVINIVIKPSPQSEFETAIEAVVKAMGPNKKTTVETAIDTARSEINRKFKNLMDILRQKYGESFDGTPDDEYNRVIEVLSNLKSPGIITDTLICNEGRNDCLVEVHMIVSIEKVKLLLDEKMHGMQSFWKSRASREIEERLANEYMEEGNKCFRQKRKNEALKYFIKAWKILERWNDKIGVTTCLNDIVKTHLALGQYDMVKHYRRALGIYSPVGTIKLSKSFKASRLNRQSHAPIFSSSSIVTGGAAHASPFADSIIDADFSSRKIRATPDQHPVSHGQHPQMSVTTNILSVSDDGVLLDQHGAKLVDNSGNPFPSGPQTPYLIRGIDSHDMDLSDSFINYYHRDNRLVLLGGGTCASYLKKIPNDNASTVTNWQAKFQRTHQSINESVTPQHPRPTFGSPVNAKNILDSLSRDMMAELLPYTSVNRNWPINVKPLLELNTGLVLPFGRKLSQCLKNAIPLIAVDDQHQAGARYTGNQTKSVVEEKAITDRQEWVIAGFYQQTGKMVTIQISLCSGMTGEVEATVKKEISYNSCRKSGIAQVPRNLDAFKQRKHPFPQGNEKGSIGFLLYTNKGGNSVSFEKNDTVQVSVSTRQTKPLWVRVVDYTPAGDYVLLFDGVIGGAYARDTVVARFQEHEKATVSEIIAFGSTQKIPEIDTKRDDSRNLNIIQHPENIAPVDSSGAKNRKAGSATGSFMGVSKLIFTTY